jgi:hypothetical protein
MGATAGPLPPGDDWAYEDGELVTFLDGGPSFSVLQQRLQVGSPSAGLVRAVPVAYLVFDVLHMRTAHLSPTAIASPRTRRSAHCIHPTIVGEVAFAEMRPTITSFATPPGAAAAPTSNPRRSGRRRCGDR